MADNINLSIVFLFPFIFSDRDFTLVFVETCSLPRPIIGRYQNLPEGGLCLLKSCKQLFHVEIKFQGQKMGTFGFLNPIRLIYIYQQNY